MKYLFSSLLIMFLIIGQNTFAQEKQQEKIQASTQVLTDFIGMKENIPQQLLKVTEGIIIVPKLINAGFVFAGKHGKGIALVKLSDGSWSNPVFVTITGGSIGFQAGIQSVDLILVFKNAETLKNIGTGSFTLGGDVSVTVGPEGRNSSASTDYKMEAEVFSYSRSKGLFAGISISGSAIEVDSKFNRSFYGDDLDSEEIFSSENIQNKSLSKLQSVLKNMNREASSLSQ
ncbi:MAG: lipid-binding SYLF domain-containing protein [Ginsengibacter sp.]